jgi:hypothetical protein
MARIRCNAKPSIRKSKALIAPNDHLAAAARLQVDPRITWRDKLGDIMAAPKEFVDCVCFER